MKEIKDESRCSICGKRSCMLYCKESFQFYYGVEWYCRKCYKKEYGDDPENWVIPKEFQLEE